MNKHQKEIELTKLSHEQKAFQELRKTYTQALADTKAMVKKLQEDVNILESSNLEEKSILQSRIYQLNYQKAMEEQLTAICGVINSKNVTNVQTFLTKMYQDSYLGVNYNLQKSGIPIIMAANPSLIVKSINTPTNKLKFSETLYKRTEELKKAYKEEISRGIATGKGYKEIAKQLDQKTKIGFNNAYRIARTEGGRVSSEASMTAMRDAKAKGADIVKQWLATLDMRTRDAHARLDGQIREVEEEFEIDGDSAMCPHGFTSAGLNINCRCAVLSVPRWDVEDTYIRYDDKHNCLIESKNYEDWKKGYYVKLEENPEVTRIILKAEERIKGYTTSFKGVNLADNQIYISSEDNKRLAEYYIESYENRDLPLRPFEEERYKKLLELKEKGFPDEIITLDSVEGCDRLLDKINWMIETRNNISETDIQLLREATEEIYKITQRVPAIMDDSKINKYFLDAVSYTDCMAYTQGNTITLNNQFFSSYKSLYEQELENLKTHNALGHLSTWHTQVAEGNETKSIIVHELGHIVHKSTSWVITFEDEELQKKFAHFKKEDSYYPDIDDVRKEMIEEPIRRVMTKEGLTRKEVIDKYVSEYGKSDYEEMFAETFANSQLGKSNSLGDELIKYLEELGLWK